MTTSSRNCPVCDVVMPVVSAGRVCDVPQCRVTYRRHLEIGGPTCLVCGRPISEIRRRTASTCGHTQCDVQYLREKHLPADRRCRICRVPLLPRRLSIGVCDDRECEAMHAGQRLAEKAQREKEHRKRLYALADFRKQHEAGATFVDNPNEFTAAVVPHIPAPLRPRDEARIARVRARLESIVEWAFTHEPDESELHTRASWNSGSSSKSSLHEYKPDEIGLEATAAESALFSVGCRLCRGACCKTGAEHAYLNIGLIRRFLATHPELSAEQVVEAYLSFVPELSVKDSCIFHGRCGCTLPREMRSDMCNRWLCPGLKQIRESLKITDNPMFFIAAADEKVGHEEIYAAEFVDVTDPMPSSSH